MSPEPGSQSPRLHHRGRCHVWPCASVPFYDAQLTHVTPQGGADKSLSSVLSLAPRRNMPRVPCESFRV